METKSDSYIKLTAKDVFQRSGRERDRLEALRIEHFAKLLRPYYVRRELKRWRSTLSRWERFCRWIGRMPEPIIETNHVSNYCLVTRFWPDLEPTLDSFDDLLDLRLGSLPSESINRLNALHESVRYISGKTLVYVTVEDMNLLGMPV